MASAHIKKGESEERWESFKESIRAMYLDDNLTLEGDDGVIGQMDKLHNFRAT